MNTRRILVLSLCLVGLLLTPTTVALAEDSDSEGDTGDSQAAVVEPADSDTSDAPKITTTQGGVVTFTCPSFALTETWNQRTSTWNTLDASASLVSYRSRTTLRATIVKSPQGTVYTDRGHWTTTWSADTGLTVTTGVLEQIRTRNGKTVVSDFGSTVTNADGVIVEQTGHHPANAYAWCLALA